MWDPGARLWNWCFGCRVLGLGAGVIVGLIGLRAHRAVRLTGLGVHRTLRLKRYILEPRDLDLIVGERDTEIKFKKLRKASLNRGHR